MISLLVTFEDVKRGDGILVSVSAPSLPAALAPVGVPSLVSDTLSNTYNLIGTHLWEASPPNVNEGCVQSFFYCPSSVGDLPVSATAIFGIWTHPVYDRVLYAWLVRHDGGNPTVAPLASTADNDAAVFASNQMTLTAPNYTPVRDHGLEFATLISAKAGGVGGFGGVGGYNGFFQAQFRSFGGSKQSYLFNAQTHGANVFLVIDPPASQYELDLGKLPGGVIVPAFNGVGQTYSLGTNAWKGISLFGVD